MAGHPGAMQGGSRSVFIGNIPYGTTQQELIDIFQTVGQVVNFRLVHDRDTGKPKGLRLRHVLCNSAMKLRYFIVFWGQGMGFVSLEM